MASNTPAMLWPALLVMDPLVPLKKTPSPPIILPLLISALPFSVLETAVLSRENTRTSVSIVTVMLAAP